MEIGISGKERRIITQRALELEIYGHMRRERETIEKIEIKKGERQERVYLWYFSKPF